MPKYSNVLLFQLHNLVVKLVSNTFFKVCRGRDCTNTAFDLHFYFQYFICSLVLITIQTVLDENCDNVIHSFCNWRVTHVYSCLMIVCLHCNFSSRCINLNCRAIVWRRYDSVFYCCSATRMCPTEASVSCYLRASICYFIHDC